jgi:hypothetical protein
MARPLILALAAAATMCSAGVAHAGGNVFWSIGINLPAVGTVISNAPVYAPAPVYVPAPVYYEEPAPVYYEPPQVVYRPVPRAYYPAQIAYVHPAPLLYPRFHPQWKHRDHGWERGDRDNGNERRWHHDEYGNRFSR